MSERPASNTWSRLWWNYALHVLLIVGICSALGYWLKRWEIGLALGFAIGFIFYSFRLYRILKLHIPTARLPASIKPNVFSLIEYAIDQRRHRRRTRRLLQILRRYRHTAAALPDGALFLDRKDQKIIWFNKTARHWLQLQYPQSIGQRIDDIFPSKEFQRWLAEPDTEHNLAEIRSPNNPGQFLSFRLINYSADLWLILIRDMSKLVRLEQTRRDFVANVSHELRTPLTVIHGYLDMLEPEPDSPEAPLIKEMRAQSMRMTQLVEDLLTLSRLESQESLPDEAVSMSMMMNMLKREAEALSQGKHKISIDRTCLADLHGSSKELHSAFSNLVSNAVRYTPQHGSIIILWKNTAQGGAEFAVQDNGYGIPANHIPRITERFYRVSNSRSRETGGTGLGLSIVKHVLNLHGAHLQVQSEVGKGSRFSCVFGSERLIKST
jgi:two-component system, OmpR family, phosphate regulon sensor histidine kinase PhoR